MSGRTVRVVLEAVTSGYEGAMRRAASATEGLNAKVKENAQSAHQVSNGLAVVGAAALGVAALAVKQYSSFAQAMSGVQAATRASAADMELLREAAKTLGADTKYSASEAAGGIEALGRAGVSTQDILGGGLAGALSLAAAGELEVATAAELASVAMTQFKLSGRDVPRVADMLAAGAGKAMGSVADLGMALKQGGLVASQFGLGLDETVGTLAAFASAGLLGSDAGTSLKTMLQRLANPSKEAANLMQELGISAYDASGKFVGVAGLAGQLEAALGGMSDAQRNAAMSTIFGSDAIRAASVLYDQGASGIRDWTAAVDDAGYAAEQAALLQDNLAGDMEKLGGAWESLAIAMGSAADGPLRTVVQGLDDLLTALAAAPGAAEGLMVGITALGGVALAAAGVGKAVIFVNEMKTAITALGGSMRGLTLTSGAIGLGLAAVSALVAAFAAEKAAATERETSFAAALQETNGAIRDQQGALQESVRAAAAKVAQDEGLLDIAERYGVSLGKVTEAMTGNVDAANEVLESIRTQSAEMAQFGGDAQSAVADYEAMRDGLRRANGSLDEAQNKHRQLAEATGESGTAAEGAATSTQELAAATAEAAASAQEQADALSDAAAAIDAYYSAVLSAENSAIALESAIDKASAAVSDNGRTLDTNTEKGRANASALLDIAEAGHRVAADMGAAGKSQEEVAASVTRAREAFISAADAMGMSAEEAAAYADQLGLIPDEVASRVTMTGGDTAILTAQELVAALAGLPPERQTQILTPGAVEAIRSAGLVDAALAVIPPEVATVFSTPGASAAQAEASRTQAAYDSVQDTVTATFGTPGSAAAQAEARRTSAALSSVPTSINSKINVSSNASSVVSGALTQLRKLDGKTVTAEVILKKYGQVEKAGGGYVGHAAEAIGLASGGMARKRYPYGGVVEGPGTTTSDSVPAMLSRREFVQRAAAVEYYGVEAMYALNARRIPREVLQGYAGGGSPGYAEPARYVATSPAAAPAVQVVTNRVDVGELRQAVADGLRGVTLELDGHPIEVRVKQALSAEARTLGRLR